VAAVACLLPAQARDGCPLPVHARARTRARGVCHLCLVPRYYGTLVLYQHRQARRATRQAPGWYHATEPGRHAVRHDYTTDAAGGRQEWYQSTI